MPDPLAPSALRRPDDNPVAAALLNDAASRGERWVSVARIAFCSATLIRSLGALQLTAGTEIHPKFWVGPPAELFAIAFSLFMLSRLRKGPVAHPLLALSVTVDAVVCFTTLLPNALWPYPDYEGVFSVPDSAAMLIMIVVSGFRLVPYIAWLSTFLNAAAATILVALDHARLPQPPRYEADVLVLMAIFAGGCMAVSIAFATQTRRLVIAAAQAAQRAAEAKRNLYTFLQDNHDVRSLLSSANLNSDVLVRDMSAQNPLYPQAERLQKDLKLVSDFLRPLQERSPQQLHTFDAATEVNIAEALQSAGCLLARRYPDVRLEAEIPPSTSALLAGGERSLERVFLNLLVNAAEGDGKRGAHRIRVSLVPMEPGASPPLMKLVVDDDGPGFAIPLNDPGHAEAATTKPDGSGLGLFFVDRLLSASGGSLFTGEISPLGGARVAFTLAAPKAP